MAVQSRYQQAMGKFVSRWATREVLSIDNNPSGDGKQGKCSPESTRGGRASLCNATARELLFTHVVCAGPTQNRIPVFFLGMTIERYWKLEIICDHFYHHPTNLQVRLVVGDDLPDWSGPSLSPCGNRAPTTPSPETLSRRILSCLRTSYCTLMYLEERRHPTGTCMYCTEHAIITEETQRVVVGPKLVGESLALI